MTEAISAGRTTCFDSETWSQWDTYVVLGGELRCFTSKQFHLEKAQSQSGRDCYKEFTTGGLDLFLMWIMNMPYLEGALYGSGDFGVA